MTLRRNLENRGDGTFRVRKMVRGRIHQRVFSTRAAAVAFVRHLELLAAGVPVENGPATVGSVLALYKAKLVRLGRSPLTVEYYEKVGRHLTHELGEDHPWRLAPYEVDGYVERRKADGAGDAAVLKEIRAYRSMLVSCGLPAFRPPELRPVRHHRRLPSDEEIATVLTKAPPRLRLALWLGLLTGMRPSEVLALDWRDVDLERGVIRVTLRKVAWENVIPVVPTLARELGEPGSGPVVGLTKDQVSHELRGVGWGLGATRHYVVTATMDAGYTEGQVALLTGHVSGVTRRHYAHSSGSLALKRKMLGAVEKRVTMAVHLVVTPRAKRGLRATAVN